MRDTRISARYFRRAFDLIAKYFSIVSAVSPWRMNCRIVFLRKYRLSSRTCLTADPSSADITNKLSRSVHKLSCQRAPSYIIYERETNMKDNIRNKTPFDIHLRKKFFIKSSKYDMQWYLNILLRLAVLHTIYNI